MLGAGQGSLLRTLRCREDVSARLGGGLVLRNTRGRRLGKEGPSGQQSRRTRPTPRGTVRSVLSASRWRSAQPLPRLTLRGHLGSTELMPFPAALTRTRFHTPSKMSLVPLLNELPVLSTLRHAEHSLAFTGEARARRPGYEVRPGPSPVSAAGPSERT